VADNQQVLTKSANQQCSFTQVLSPSLSAINDPLLQPTIKGDSLSIKIRDEVKVIEACNAFTWMASLEQGGTSRTQPNKLLQSCQNIEKQLELDLGK
jgi:hypothetical protein